MSRAPFASSGNSVDPTVSNTSARPSAERAGANEAPFEATRSELTLSITVVP